MCRHWSQFAGQELFQARVGLAFNPLTLMCLPFAPFCEPLYSPRALPPWWALSRLLLDSVLLSALRHYQWVMGGKSAPVAHQRGRAMSANYRHYLLLPPVSSLRPGLKHSTITDSTWSLHYPQLPLLFPPASEQTSCVLFICLSECMRVCVKWHSLGFAKKGWWLWFSKEICWSLKGPWLTLAHFFHAILCFSHDLALSGV